MKILNISFPRVEIEPTTVARTVRRRTITPLRHSAVIYKQEAKLITTTYNLKSNKQADTSQIISKIIIKVIIL